MFGASKSKSGAAEGRPAFCNSLPTLHLYVILIWLNLTLKSGTTSKHIHNSPKADDDYKCEYAINSEGFGFSSITADCLFFITLTNNFGVSNNKVPYRINNKKQKTDT